jgi:hypothetical protein
MAAAPTRMAAAPTRMPLLLPGWPLLLPGWPLLLPGWPLLLPGWPLLLPGLPLLLPGCADTTLIRDIQDLECWIAEYYKDDEWHLEDSHAAAVKAFNELCEGVSEDNGGHIRYRLPSRSSSGIKLWVSSRQQPSPAKVKVAGHSIEKIIISCMIGELRDKQALDLDPSPSFERGLVLQARAKTTVDYLVIGSSHATHLSKLLTEQGYSTRLVSIPNWRIYKGSAS